MQLSLRGENQRSAPGTRVVPASVSGTAERKTIQQPARRRRWFLTPSARKGMRVNSACAYGARRDCNQILATRDPTHACVQRVGLASPLAVRAEQSRTHPQKRAEDHRRAGAHTEWHTTKTSVSFGVLLWMHWHFGRESKTKITLTTDLTDQRNTNSTIRAIGVIRGRNLHGPRPRGSDLGRKTAPLGRSRTQAISILRPQVK